MPYIVSAHRAIAAAVRPLCRLDSFSFVRARSYAVYNHALHSAVLLLNYEEVPGLGERFAAKLAEVIAREPDQFRADLVVPPFRCIPWRVRYPRRCAS
jgi:predicted amidophosphoribosyltransferase